MDQAAASDGLESTKRKRRYPLVLLAVALAGVIGGPFLIWQALHERNLNRTVAHAEPCPSGVQRSDCIVARAGIVVSVIQPTFPASPLSGNGLNQPGAGNSEPEIVLRLADGKRLTLDIGFKNVPRVGADVTAFYYGGYLLRATTTGDLPLATSWTPGKWHFHLLTGIGLLVLAVLAGLRWLRTSPGRYAPKLADASL